MKTRTKTLEDLHDVTEAASAPSDVGAAAPDRVDDNDPGPGLRISDAASKVGVSARTLRYYEELGLLSPSGRTVGGERRYQAEDLSSLERIWDLKDVLGMNLDEIRDFLATEDRLANLRTAYRARNDQPTEKARAEQRAIVEEAIELNTTLMERLDVKVSKMKEFRAKLAASATRCQEVLDELDSAGT